jgi:D-3-phosphoglycerate dehydrogenase
VKVFISTVPFAAENKTPLEILEAAGVEYLINPTGRKLKESEISEYVSGVQAVIAGTEPITDKVLEEAKNLQLIARVGIGLDSVDLCSASRRGIAVSYTPDAPSPSVAELTIGLMLSCLRHVHLSNEDMHRGGWNRYFGRRLGECVVGVIGMGRIGSRVVSLLESFKCKKILLNDLVNTKCGLPVNTEWCEKEKIYHEADIISLHVPLTLDTRNLVTKRELLLMKKNAIVINTARGGIVNEDDLSSVLGDGHLGAAAIDTFENEPYSGPLSSIERCLLTSHLGSMSLDCRCQMEIEAAQEVARFVLGEPLAQPVPAAEYENQNSASGG